MIGIITVNWRGFEITRELIQHIRQSQHQDFRLVVVNNSPEEVGKFSAELVPDERVLVLHAQENLGFSGGINLGLKALLTEPKITHFIIMNNDVELKEDFINGMLSHATRSDRIYSPLIFLRDTNLIYNTGGRVRLWLGGTVNLNNHVPAERMRRLRPDYFSGCVLFFHREVIEKVGLFDETFGTYYEDVDFCYRAKAAGIALEMIWDVTARHFHSFSTRGDNTHKIYLLNRNQILFARKHLDPLPRAVFISAAVKRGFITNLKPSRFRHFLRGVQEGFSTPIPRQVKAGPV